MPATRFFNTIGKEIFPPRPVNVGNDPDAPNLRINIAPPSHYLPAEMLPNIATAPRTAAIVAGGAIPIVADDAPHTKLPNGVLAQAVGGDALYVPSFFGPDEFPEPVFVEAESLEKDRVTNLMPGALGEDTPVATGMPHAMTTAEKQALEQEFEQLQAGKS